jgi:two-component system chemotaxis response regulator CheB
MALSPKTFAPDALRVMVVDDLGFMRIALRQIIEANGDMHVVGEARDGEEAVALARELKPDVITMDIEMPRMDGIEATRLITTEASPRTIVIMVSSHTQEGAAATIRALRQGASDFVSKQSAFSNTDLGHIDSELPGKIRTLAHNRRKAPTVAEPRAVHTETQHYRNLGDSVIRPTRGACLPGRAIDLVVIGVSTGGPATLATLLRAIGPIPVPMVVAQHMPQFFTACLAQSLTEDTGLRVSEGSHRQPLIPGEVTILPGGRDAVVAPHEGGSLELRLTHADGAVHPSADLLFESAAMVARQPVAVILTGMGDDGTRGGGRLVRRNLPVLVQRPDTCVVGGMPSAAIEAGVASESLTLDEIASRLRRWASPTYSPRNPEGATP